MIEKITIDFARRDDCLDSMVPSDLRLLISEKEQLQQTNQELLEAIEYVRGIICEASEHGFNHAVGDWAERLFLSNAQTSEAITNAKRVMGDKP